MTKSIYVNPDSLNILSATDDGATTILLAQLDKGGVSDFTDCVVYVPTKVFLGAMGEWINHKAGYNKHGGEFAGVGSIIFEPVRKVKRDVWLRACILSTYDPESDAGKDFDADEFESDRPVSVDAYVASEWIIDMEHG